MFGALSHLERKNTSTNSSHLLDGDTPSIKSNYHNTNGIESQHRKTGPQASYNAKEYNPDWYNKSLTGAWANCTEPTNPQRSTDDNHSDERQVIVSCHTIFYRVPTESFKQVKDIVVGVLSGAEGQGPSLRQAIREAWASHDSKGRTEENVFFLVAGPWQEVKYEYEEHKDLLWIDDTVSI